ncbi:MAG TPA: GNAT family N-acetyltransferase [Solirubrobacterales bacterium]|jgi:CelD/BcsL family acetyltransferase involved in cellulose biosynthesis
MSPVRRLREVSLTDDASRRQEVHGDVVSVEKFEALADEWDDLALRTGAAPFVRPGWIEAWWATFGRGELQILALRHKGDLACVLPLRRRRGLLRSCSNVHTPVFDAVSVGLEEVQVLLTAALDQSRGVILEGLDSDGMLAGSARELDDQRRSRLVVLDQMLSPYVDLSVSWETFEKSLSGSRRRNVRRRRKRLAELGEVTIDVFDGSADLEPYFEEFLRLEATGWKADLGTAVSSSVETTRFYHDVMAWAAEKKLLRLSFVRVGGRGVAVALLLDDGHRRHNLKVGFDDEYAPYYAGVLQNFEEIRRALEDGRTFEWGGAMNGVKEWLHNAEHSIEQLGLFPRSPRGTAAGWSIGLRQAVYRWARGSAPLRRARGSIRRRLTRQLASPSDTTPG